MSLSQRYLLHNFQPYFCWCRFFFAPSVNARQELSLAFHQDWRLVNQGREIVGDRVVYFYSNGSATANRGAEVCKRNIAVCNPVSKSIPPGYSSAAPRSSWLRNRILHREGQIQIMFPLNEQCQFLIYLTLPLALSTLLWRTRRLQCRQSRRYNCIWQA